MPWVTRVTLLPGTAPSSAGLICSWIGIADGKTAYLFEACAAVGPQSREEMFSPRVHLVAWLSGWFAVILLRFDAERD